MRVYASIQVPEGERQNHISAFKETGLPKNGLIYEIIGNQPETGYPVGLLVLPKQKEDSFAVFDNMPILIGPQ